MPKINKIVCCKQSVTVSIHTVFAYVIKDDTM